MVFMDFSFHYFKDTNFLVGYCLLVNRYYFVVNHFRGYFLDYLMDSDSAYYYCIDSVNFNHPEDCYFKDFKITNCYYFSWDLVC